MTTLSSWSKTSGQRWSAHEKLFSVGRIALVELADQACPFGGDGFTLMAGGWDPMRCDFPAGVLLLNVYDCLLIPQVPLNSQISKLCCSALVLLLGVASERSRSSDPDWGPRS